jgi:uncharacterized membrane protein
MATPSTSNKLPKKEPNYNWSKYIGLGSQLIAGLLITIFIGKKLDLYFNKHSFFAWVAPTLFILTALISVVRDTQNKN